MTAPTASRATADPVPKANPCIMVEPRFPSMDPPPLWPAAGGGGAARLAGGGALRAAGGGARERPPDDLPPLPISI